VEEWKPPPQKTVIATYSKKEYTLKLDHNIWQALVTAGIKGTLRLADKDVHEIEADDINDGDRSWVSQRR
jgi:hypothetical protein